jgi:hypothetical protein
MKIPARFILILTLALLVTSFAFAEERIHSFHSDVRINQDGSIDVTETIVVKAEGRAIRRGIYRDFPTSYEDRLGQHYRVGFDFNGVKLDGVPETWHTKRQDNGVRVYIGKSNVYLDPGIYRYELSYRTTRQLGFFDEHDELFWNVTGNDWQFPIDVASAIVHLPEGVAEPLQFTAYTGASGEAGTAWLSESGYGQVSWRTTAQLKRYEGLSVVVSWQAGFVKRPTGNQKIRWFLADNPGPVIGVIGFLLTGLYLAIAWWLRGRDPEGRPIHARFDLPEYLSPASARYLDRMRFDNKVFTAAILSLATRGHISMQENAAREMTLSRQENAGHVELPDDEKQLVQKLFSGKNSVTLKKGNHKQVRPARTGLKEWLVKTWKGSHFRRNGWWLAPGIALGIITLFTASVAGMKEDRAISAGIMPMLIFMPALFLALRNRESMISSKLLIGVLLIPNVLVLMVMGTFVGAWFALLAVAMIWMLFRFADLMPAPTPAGREIMDRLDGLKLYLEHAEEERLDQLHPPEKTPETFEKYLPWAVALNLENEWAEQFSEVLEKAGREENYSPRWYHGRNWNPSRPVAFAGAVGAALTTTIAAASMRPGSSSGFSGGGGGGYSGGGGGGGGGGGW